MPRLDWLEHHMAHSDTLAQWLHQQFHYEYADVPLADWQREFAEGQRNGQGDAWSPSTATACWAAPPWPATTCPGAATLVRGWPACSSPRKHEGKAWRNN